MNTNSNQSTDKNHSGAVCRIMGVLFGLLAFIWLPAAVRGQPIAFEPDNTPEQASFIYDRGERNFHEAQDEDWMLFYGPKNEPDYTYEISVTALGSNTNLDPVWTIYDSDGKTVLLKSSDGDQFTPPQDDDIYFIKVYNRDPQVFGDDTSYEISIFRIFDFYSVLYGVVRDEETRERLTGVTVSLVGTESTKSKKSPSAGVYAIKFFTDHPYTLRAELAGYRLFQQEFSKNTGVIHIVPAVINTRKDIELTSLIPISSSMQLISPPNCESGVLVQGVPSFIVPDKCSTPSVTVFRWTRSDNPRVSSYRLIIAEDKNMNKVVPNLPAPGDKRIIIPQVAVRFPNSMELGNFYWRVIALDKFGTAVEQSQKIFSIYFPPEGVGFEYTIISGLVKSDWNQAALVGAQVNIISERHAITANPLDPIAATEFNGEYIVIAVTAFDHTSIPFPIVITSKKEGFQDTAIDLAESENINGEIKRDLLMKPIDSDKDGIPDVIESPPSCLKANDADTDDDGIADGDEDTNKNGVKDSGETHPCRRDTDNDGIQDGTERGYTRKGPDTDINIFQPDQDPTTTTNPLDADTDDDGIVDGDEDTNKNGDRDPGETDPRAADSDGDGISDKVEIDFRCLDANDADTDDDGIVDGDEDTNKDGDRDPGETDPCDADTDDDGILDGNEDADHDGTVDDNETNPRDADTDKDGLLDGTEIGLTAPQGSGTEGNMFPDADPTTTTDPLDPDSDNDGLLDGDEDSNHNGRVDAGETDPNFSSAGALPAILLPLLLGD